MSKAVYTFLTYPESCDTALMESVLSSADLSFCHSPVHDSDLLEKPEGEQIYKKPHVHWLVGYETKPPKIADFVAFIKQNKGVASAQSVLVKNPWKAVDYLTHKNNPEKAQYSAENCFFSDSWDVDRFTTQEQRNTKRRDDKASSKKEESAIIGEILDMCGVSPDKCNGFQPLVDKVRKEKPDYFPYVLKNAFFIREYLHSLIVEKRLETSLSQEVDKLNRIINNLNRENADLFERLQFAEQSCICYYQQLFGEAPPPSWEWSSSDEERALKAGDA